MNKDNSKKIETSVVPFENSSYSKSNAIISAKYQTSLNEAKITQLALFKAQNYEFTETKEGLVVSFTPKELKEALGLKGNGLYEELDKIGISMASKAMGISDPTTRSFDYISLINRARYNEIGEDGERTGMLKITFNPGITDYIVNIKNNFTILDKNVMLGFKTTYAMRLYEILKQQCYYPKTYEGEKNNVFSIKMNLSELKLELGVVNMSDENVKKALNKKGGPDYEQAVEKAKDKRGSYDRWDNFKNRCLDKAIKEINKKEDCELYIEYATIGSGRGNKVVGIAFTVYLNGAEKIVNIIENDGPTSNEEIETVKKSKTLSQNEKFPIWIEVSTIFKRYGLELDAVESICNAADYDVDLIRKAKENLDECSSDIGNVVGWLINCIKSGGYESKTKKASEKKNSEKKNKFNNFDQREYDFDELEIQLASVSNKSSKQS